MVRINFSISGQSCIFETYIMKKSSDFILGLFFDSDDRGDMFIRNVGCILTSLYIEEVRTL
jgi:hypothetical protein